ncbi:hypothetical protein [Streptomyces sparsogenes]|uniref:hypothetical protein n=1 Tax=Streptomyces sparsogenes TaxID=67365 RepID=UPI001301A3A0|nr:hypothetical protein [Streptomyces sparsogenes]
MTRFLLGLLLGGCGSAITWAASHNTGWTIAIGATVAVLVWLGEYLLDDLT